MLWIFSGKVFKRDWSGMFSFGKKGGNAANVRRWLPKTKGKLVSESSGDAVHLCDGINGYMGGACCVCNRTGNVLEVSPKVYKRAGRNYRGYGWLVCGKVRGVDGSCNGSYGYSAERDLGEGDTWVRGTV